MRQLFLFTVLVVSVLLSGCLEEPSDVNAVKPVGVQVQTDQDGRTIEQNNVARRLTEDNKPGTIKHLYLISSFTGDVLLYSPVKGKVTSSGKRLRPTELELAYRQSDGKETWYTKQAMGDDGTYGSSVEYLYWWDVYGVYRQLYVGGSVVIISSQPIRTKKAIITLTQVKE